MFGPEVKSFHTEEIDGKIVAVVTLKESKPSNEVVRCAAFIPGGIQCSQPMYHIGPCQFDHVMPFSTHVKI